MATRTKCPSCSKRRVLVSDGICRSCSSEKLNPTEVAEINDAVEHFRTTLYGDVKSIPLTMSAAESNTSVVPKTRKSRSPKEEQQIVRETAAIVLKPFGTPLSPEKARDLIAEAMSARVHTPYASSKSSPNPHNDPITAKWLDSTPQVPQLDETPVGVKIKPTATPIVNTVGVEVAKVSRGSKTSYPIFGHSHTKFFLWAGQSQWSVSEVQTALKAFGIPEISVLSIRTFLYAGRKGGDCAGRGEAPKYTPEQAKQLEAAGGRVVDGPDLQPPYGGARTRSGPKNPTELGAEEAPKKPSKKAK